MVTFADIGSGFLLESENHSILYPRAKECNGAPGGTQEAPPVARTVGNAPRMLWQSH